MQMNATGCAQNIQCVCADIQEENSAANIVGLCKKLSKKPSSWTVQLGNEINFFTRQLVSLQAR